MDPLTHTLVGATLAESGLKRWTPRAATTLIVGANLPDIDGVAILIGQDTSLWLRRGWTHGVLALLVLPALLSGVMYVWARRRPTIRPPSLAALLALAYLAVLSHPALDWLNNYGIRLLMPFDGRWFYGDAVFIVDPWLWLLLGGTMAISCTRSRAGVMGWTTFAAAASWLMFNVAAVPFAARACWVIGVLAVALIRIRRGPIPAPPMAARICLAVAVLYIGSMVVGTRIAERQVASWVDREGLEARAVMAGPVPANPFRRQVVVETPSDFHFLELDWLEDPILRITGPPLERQPVSPVVAAALSAPSVRGVTGWLRFPRYEVETLADGYRVTISDMRFSRTLATGLGSAVVELDADLRPR